MTKEVKNQPFLSLVSTKDAPLFAIIGNNPSRTNPIIMEGDKISEVPFSASSFRLGTPAPANTMIAVAALHPISKVQLTLKSHPSQLFESWFSIAKII